MKSPALKFSSVAQFFYGFRLFFAVRRGMPLCFLVVSCVCHETPVDRTVLDVIIASGQVGFRSCKLHVGQLIRLSFYTDYGVLSVLNHGDHVIYVGMSNGAELQWFEAPSDVDGFYAMGPAGHAIVEIVAVKETEIRFVGCSLDDVAPPCARVAAAHSHEPDLDALLPSTCFLSTDSAAAVRLAGDAANASVRVDDRFYNWSAPLPSDGLTLQIACRISGSGSDFESLRFRPRRLVAGGTNERDEQWHAQPLNFYSSFSWSGWTCKDRASVRAEGPVPFDEKLCHDLFVAQCRLK
jgi:hypothetical protein